MTLQREGSEIWIAISGLIGSIVGYFSANAQQVIGFYFGSSAGSAAKTDQLAETTQDAFNAIGRSSKDTSPPAIVRADGETATAAVGEAAVDELDELDEGNRPKTGKEQQANKPATNVKWDACVTYVLEREGGFVADHDDPGGPTNMGITQRTLAAWRNEDVTQEDVQELRVDEAKAIYRSNYWNVARCDVLPPGVDLSVFDAAVMSGPAQAVRFLQRASGMQEQDVDGVVGPQTLGFVKNVSQTRLIEEIARQRDIFYENIVAKRPASDKFLKGWKNRVSKTRDRALSMARLWS
jgi:lysozyme family protein